MAIVEIEVWSDDAEDDYARLLTGLEDDSSRELYQHLYECAEEWCQDKSESPEIFRRTTGRPVKLADLIRWYQQEGLLYEVEVNGTTAFRPDSEVEEALKKDTPLSFPVPVHDD